MCRIMNARFFFPWPHQPHQCDDENTERVALQRRLPEDDQWLNPHNLYMTMFSPATVHVLPFDPTHGADQARQYAGKYASKPEKLYYLETERDGVKDFLKCRTVIAATHTIATLVVCTCIAQQPIMHISVLT